MGAVYCARGTVGNLSYALARSSAPVSAMARRAAVTLAVIAAIGAGPRRAWSDSPAEQLGRAFRAYDAGDLAQARSELQHLAEKRLKNPDYALWLRGQLALLDGDGAAAHAAFTDLAKAKGSRFAAEVPWRLADADWLRDRRRAATDAYAKLIKAADAGDHGDVGTARFRIAVSRKGAAMRRALHEFRVDFPQHPLEAEAIARLTAAGEDEHAFTADERIARAQHLTESHLWHEAVAELSLIPDGEARVRRDYWLGTTLFKMRRRYADAGKLLLGVAPDMGGSAAEATFHGARALSRADLDDQAIVWYRKVVEKWPKTAYAQEAAYLIGWLDFNRGNYAEAIAPLEESLRAYPRSKFADDSLWFLGMSQYLLGHYKDALATLQELATHRGALEGGKGAYWVARTQQQLGDTDAAQRGYRELVRRWPFSWYALLGRAQLAKAGVAIGPFGVDAPRPRGPSIDTGVDPADFHGELMGRIDELIAAGLTVEAGDELARNESAIVKGDRAHGYAVLFDRYRAAGIYYRPWMIALTRGAAALDGPAEGSARVWWETAYPRAYRELIEKYQALGDNPEGYLYSIMRKESGFNPHDLSYADAQGLLQMIPATTQRVAKALKLPYAAGRLYEPEFNIMTGSWYIGHLLQKFKGQIPIGAGSFNSGPRPVMKWLDQNGDRPIDEFVELVPYMQTREYMKKVTENYARYVYLYQGTIYEQPLTVDKAYLANELVY
ncbi:MAG: transglycosylase SLT domain-containing protein [Deltaproteobacteria bacterium]|nr:transglycosylase SLT domain-containing protein [Deltaproteobacteria bacterium]